MNLLKIFILNNNFFNTLNYKSSGSYRKYNTNVDEADFINDFIFTSNNFKIIKKFRYKLGFID